MRRPSKHRAPRLIVLALATLAPAAGAKAEKPGPLRGQVLAMPDTGKLTDRLLFIDGRQAPLRDGRFKVARAGARYDAWLVDKAQQTVTIYQGLTRRDPVLWVHGDGSGSPESHQATVHGILRGDFPFPIQQGRGLNVYFFAGAAAGFWQAHPLEWNHGTAAGPRFGRLHVSWQGGESIDGELLALGETAAEKQRWTSAALAHAPLTLRDGAESFAEMTMKDLPIGHIAGAVSIDGKDVVREIAFTYQLQGSRGRLALGGCHVRKTYDCRLPDLGALGGEYCASIYYQFPLRYEANGNATRCGGELGMTDFSFHVGPKPEWARPSERMLPDGTLAWKDQGKGIYRVHLAPAFDSKVRGPVVEIFTTQASVRWPDAKAWGVAFPAGATYKAELKRMSYGSLDQVTSSGGFDKHGDYEEAEAPPLDLNMVKP